MEKQCLKIPFLPERMNINGCKKLIYNLYGKKNYVDQIRSLKQAIKSWTSIKKGS